MKTRIMSEPLSNIPGRAPSKLTEFPASIGVINIRGTIARS